MPQRNTDSVSRGITGGRAVPVVADRPAMQSASSARSIYLRLLCQARNPGLSHWRHLFRPAHSAVRCPRPSPQPPESLLRAHVAPVRARLIGEEALTVRFALARRRALNILGLLRRTVHLHSVGREMVAPSSPPGSSACTACCYTRWRRGLLLYFARGRLYVYVSMPAPRAGPLRASVAPGMRAGRANLFVRSVV